jgi:RsiW-degrading membrane proteinase PrsW (M82 family)
MYMDNNLMAIAIIPGLLILAYVYGKDKVEKEPISMIMKIVFMGAASCLVAGAAEGALQSVLPQYERGTIQFALQTSFCLAALCEETVKYLALRIGSWKSRYFNYRFDGIVYGVSAAVGFAIYENIMYVAMYGIQTAIVRAFTAIPLHAFCGVFMGVLYSYSKKASILGKGGSYVLYTILALIVPMLIHGTYDTFAFLGERGTIPLLIFVVILYVASISLINNMSRADYRSGFYPAARPVNYNVEI